MTMPTDEHIEKMAEARIIAAGSSLQPTAEHIRALLSVVDSQDATIVELQRTVRGEHARRVTMLCGDFYAECSCGAVSMPYETRDGALDWKCPRQIADLEVALRVAQRRERRRRRASCE